MQALDAKIVPLDGNNLIEASAGTGKTWTIAWLYLRLVVEKGIPVSQILVVTYTDAATAELRDRIRQRLADALAWCEVPGTAPDPEGYAALAGQIGRELCQQRLRLALASFDEAAIFTIHGFCKRALDDHAFEAGLPFTNELASNEDELLTQLADQFWYQHFQQPDMLRLALLREYALTPEKLLQSVRNFIGKPYLQENIPLPDTGNFADTYQTFQQHLQTCADLWQAQGPAIIALLETAIQQGHLHKASYKLEKLPDWQATLDAGLDTPTHIDKASHAVVEKCSASYLATKTNKGKITPQHPFFAAVDELLAAHAAIMAILPAALEGLRLQLLHFLRAALPVRKRQLGILTFDDLLLLLYAALEQHPQLAAHLAQQYQAALIDEFQDTDPIQYAIFRRIFQQAAATVFYVGDPKQAIYGFRGADIHTYQQAANAANQRYTLGQNFRSHRDLLQALNHLFTQSPSPFRSGIHYQPVQAGREQASCHLPAQDGSPLPPLRLWDWDDLSGTFNRVAVEEQVAKAVAHDIARLLAAAQDGTARLGERPLASHDIAVLVRTNRQGETLQKALLQYGIPSVLQSTADIFNSNEAEALRKVLLAIAEPNNEAAIRQALATELFGYDAGRLHTLEHDTTALESVLTQFQAWHKQWQQQGFMPMFRQLLQQGGLYTHLLGLVGGERRLTNLLHLAELIHTEATLQGHSLHTLVRWLQQRAQQANQQENPLRLESDEDLVQIVTIHKSKGLEYGVVYCPYLWAEKENMPDGWFHWQNPELGVAQLDATTLADATAKQRANADRQSEALRLLYVALTRAKYHCSVVLVSGHIKNFNYDSPLNWLLFGHLSEAQALLGKATKDGMPPAQRQALMHQQLSHLCQTAAGLIAHLPLISAVPAPTLRLSDTSLASQAPRRWQHHLPPAPRIGSFSSLSAGKDDEEPDYDTLVWQSAALRAALPSRFPRGTAAGSCLHQMLEGLDFRQPLQSQRTSVLLPALQRHGLGSQWLDAAVSLLQDVLDTPLPLPHGPIRLADLPKQQRLDELEFYFPVSRLPLKALQDLLHQHLPPTWKPIHAAIDKLQFSTLKGFLKGYIDLVFTSNGQYYWVDYKSNDLGSETTDYNFPALLEAMAEHHYYLQYLIYGVAIDRYLSQRLPDYHWDTHIGGTLYLFLRGMNRQHPGAGIFWHKPDKSLITAINQLIG